MALIKAYQHNTPEISEAAFVAENATLVGNVHLGKNSSVWYGAVLRADSGSITIGENTNLQDCVVLHTGTHNDVVVGKNVTVGHCAIVHGCTLGDGVLVGMHATILNGAVIGEGSIIAAGALVTEHTVVPPHSMVMGVPGKVRGAVTPEQAAKLPHDAENYVLCAQNHAKETAL